MTWMNKKKGKGGGGGTITLFKKRISCTRVSKGERHNVCQSVIESSYILSEWATG